MSEIMRYKDSKVNQNLYQTQPDLDLRKAPCEIRVPIKPDCIRLLSEKELSRNPIKNSVGYRFLNHIKWP